MKEHRHCQNGWIRWHVPNVLKGSDEPCACDLKIMVTSCRGGLLNCVSLFHSFLSCIILYYHQYYLYSFHNHLTCLTCFCSFFYYYKKIWQLKRMRLSQSKPFVNFLQFYISQIIFLIHHTIHTLNQFFCLSLSLNLIKILFIYLSI